ncbi:hypothetical protein ACLKA7_005703 [Drosophila subpalustris]
MRLRLYLVISACSYSNYILADPLFYKPQRIDLLISSRHFFNLLLDGKVSLGEGRPSMVNTKLGWIIGGEIHHQLVTGVRSCNLATSSGLDQALLRFWEIEEFPSSESKDLLSAENQECEEHFLANTSLLDSNRVQRITYLKQRLWDLWRRDYLHELQLRSKWLKAESNVRIGQLVLVHEDNLPPQQWQLARITSAIPGSDGRVQRVENVWFRV